MENELLQMKLIRVRETFLTLLLKIDWSLFHKKIVPPSYIYQQIHKIQSRELFSSNTFSFDRHFSRRSQNTSN